MKLALTKKKLDPRTTHKKKLWSHKLLTRKKFGLTKYQQKKILDPRITHENKFRTHKTPTRPTMASESRNLGHSSYIDYTDYKLYRF